MKYRKLNQSYQFVVGIHGNERIPLIAMSVLGLPVQIANPVALAQNKRYIEKDMNASFGTKGNSHEEKEAIRLSKKLDDRSVIDFHTTRGVEESFVVIVDKSQVRLAKMLGIKRVVYMKHNIKGGNSLIDHHPGVSVECGIHDTKAAYDNVMRSVKNLNEGIKVNIELYEVFDTITKEGDYSNFVEHNDGFVPIFAMKNSYGNYGLKARRIKI